METLLTGSSIGLEKESLRVSPDGSIAQTPHPASLGSALLHPYITTDYSEAQLEFITPPFDRLQDALACLRDVQQFVYSRLEDELLWATSMPCVVAGGDSIPVARYGKSNAGIMKMIYRKGLGHRYGRVMQVISGAHFNYSFSDDLWPALQELRQDRHASKDFITANYFRILRNLLRFGWLIPYLFGASPAVCKSFLAGKPTRMQEFDSSTYYEPYATSLRMGDIGYQNSREDAAGIKACYDSLDGYIKSLACAIETPCPSYEKIGVIVDGEYRQLNANILQIENEYYSSVRPKQVPDRNEKPIRALQQRGVRYIELRSLDINAYDPLGINEDQCRFLEILMTFSLFENSPPQSELERREIDFNLAAVAHQGRNPALHLQRQGKTVPLRLWATELCEAMQDYAGLLDSVHGGEAYRQALAAQCMTVRDPELTPSARMLTEMRECGEGFYDFASRMSHKHERYFRTLPVDREKEQFFSNAVETSLREQRELEESDDLSFEDYLCRYFDESL